MAVDFQFLDSLVQMPSSQPSDSQVPMTFEQAVEYFDRLGLRYELEEHAAILEYDGGLDRDEAERQAVEEIFERSRQHALHSV